MKSTYWSFATLLNLHTLILYFKLIMFTTSSLSFFVQLQREYEEEQRKLVEKDELFSDR